MKVNVYIKVVEWFFDMRVAIVPFEFPVLSETFVINIATGLIDNGHDVEIYPLYGKPVGTDRIHPIVKKYHLLEKTFYPPRRMFMRKEIYLPLFFRFLCSRLEKNFDVIHFQFGTVALQCLPFKNLNFFKGKWVVSFRGFDISSVLKEKGSSIYAKLFRKADLFLSNSEYFRNRLIALGCDSRRAIVYRSGVDCERFKFRSQSFSNSQCIRIVSVGRLVEKKGVSYAIKAVLKLIEEGYDIEYLIIGGGPLYAELRSLIQDRNMFDRIKLLGPQDQEFIIETLEKSHIFVSSGVTAQDGDQNGPDNTIKEAMAVGLPVVACRSGAIEEVVINEKTGLLVEERDSDQLASKIKYLILNPAKWPDLTHSARKFVEEEYNLKHLTTELIEKYHSVLN